MKITPTHFVWWKRRERVTSRWPAIKSYLFILILTNYKTLFILLSFYLLRIQMPSNVTYIKALGGIWFAVMCP